MKEGITTERINRIKLTDKDRFDIKKLNEDFKKRLSEKYHGIIGYSYEDVLVTLENGHPLNRLIKNKNDDTGVESIVAYLACVSDGGGVYIKYLNSDYKHNVQLIRTELPKLITRAKKFGYTHMTFHNINSKLDTFFEKMGFVRYDNNEYAPFYKLDLTKSNDKSDELRIQKYKPWLRYLKSNSNAMEVWNSLDVEVQSHIHKLLIEAKKIDIKLYALYGYIYTLVKKGIDITKIRTLRELNSRATDIDLIETKMKDVTDISNALFENWILTNSHIKDQKHLILDELKNGLFNANKINWNFVVSKVLLKYNISPSYKTQEHDANFLYEFTGTGLVCIGKLNNPEFPYIAYSLRSKKEMRDESIQLNHCVGRSDFYIEKVRNGQIEVISLRDKNGRSVFTIEYDIKNKDIKQFKGFEDCIIENPDLLIETLNTFLVSGRYVDKISEYCNIDNNIVIYYNVDDCLYGMLDRNSTFDFIRDKNIKLLKASLKFDSSNTKEEILKLCQTPGIDLDLTNVSPDIKDQIENICCNVTDLSDNVSYKKLKNIDGDFYCPFIKSSKGLESLETVGGNMQFAGLLSAEGLISLKTIGKGANFSKLKSSKGLESLETIGKGAHFSQLVSAEGLRSLKTIGEDAYFMKLKSSKGLESLTTIGDSAFFDGLISAEGLVSLKTIGKNACFYNLISSKGLISLEAIGGTAYFRSLTEISGGGLEKLEKISGGYYFDLLTRSEKNKIPYFRNI